MMDIIHLLPDSVANQIAAGEVIQRPASCLKELVENSLDAGATKVDVIVRDAGRTLLQVIDNGKGMSDTDTRMAFERHATSKIREASDLFQLTTMGFRGEALASICAVAQVEVQTRREEDEVGTRLVIHGSQVMEQESCACAKGTNIKVKNLFYNIPVRRKFLKTDQTELRNLLIDFYRIVLVYPKVQFTFVSNDELLMELLPGTEKQRIEAVFGKGQKQAYTSHFVDIASDTDLISIRGFVGKPEGAGKNAQQYFFVNGRYMRHSYFHKAVMNAYQGLLQAEVNPSYFIYMQVNPENIDVNIHPTKTEIKFQDEQPVFQILMATVREALGKFNVSPSLDFNRDGYVEMPAQGSKPLVPPSTSHATAPYNPFRQSEKKVQNMDWQSLYTAPLPQSAVPDAVQQPLFEREYAAGPIYQYANRYLLLPTDGGLMMVDQHRAHVCVLYNMYMRQMGDAPMTSQQLLFPEVLSVPQDEVTLVQDMMGELRHIGFDIEQLDPKSFSISGVPVLLGEKNPVTALENIIAAVETTGRKVREQWRKQIALVMAKESAIPYGKPLTQQEMADLTDKLFRLDNYRFTEDGKTVVSILTDEDILKKF
ncbi:MAG: DNA mismatch repair endonuclease MutL [Paludibacteraceae bacterium]|nr:DNA mismatch repair endonuclease MutL [Paludibacteraceae bacterium]